MKFRSLACVLFVAAGTLAGCNSDGGAGPDPIAPQFYALQTVDNGSLPYLIFTDAFGGKVFVQSATLIPYAVGRTAR